MDKKTKFVKADFDPKTFFTIPNVVTMFRFITLPFIWILLYKNENLWAFALIIFAGLTDILDGFLAKILNQATPIGKVIDPVVDKIFALTLIIFLVFNRNFPPYAFVIILILEFLILLGGYILTKKHNIVPSSNTFGKIAASLISIAIWLYVIKLEIFQKNVICNISLQNLVLLLGIIFLAVATLSYYIGGKKAINSK
ncbi:MAG: CDP-alcohol phosphatidyltransferase family protein [Candidatus Cloacimonetes bacterium]|nr:CDP-alcohol phosphatidyltransferase family protein [Candidatus Cloacimonadota bacterium]MBL7108587.1 CDP-alcohol phosphatidyltransferase family protein [Candidatus Cloacimonadota bacterium]